jgi:protease-4
LIAWFALGGCVHIELSGVPDYSDPLREFTLRGDRGPKVLMVPVTGFIGMEGERGMLGAEPGLVERIVSHLEKGAEDPEVKAVVLQIDSPGGSVTGSDVLYREIESFRKRTGVKVVAAMMNVAASGGYYTALAADRIVAHPTSVTGSIGVIFLRPKISGLMDKLGVGVEITKSGPYKDMGSPFRDSTNREEEIFQNLLDSMHGRFMERVRKRRGLSGEELERAASGRVFSAPEALERGLVDRVGYLDDAFDEARKLAELPDDAPVVVYRRREYGDDNVYNTFTMSGGGKSPVGLADLDWRRLLGVPRTGFYYLWAPGLEGK